MPSDSGPLPSLRHSAPSVLAALTSLNSHLSVISSLRLQDSAQISSPCSAAWKLSPEIWLLEGSSGLCPFYQGS